jgi:hypothetical protein
MVQVVVGEELLGLLHPMLVEQRLNMSAYERLIFL